MPRTEGALPRWRRLRVLAIQNPGLRAPDHGMSSRPGKHRRPPPRAMQIGFPAGAQAYGKGRRRTGRGAGVHANPEPRVTSPGLWDVFPSWKTQTTPPSCNANRMPCWGAGVRKGAQAYVKGRGRTGRGAGVHANPEPRVTSPGLWDVFPSWKTPTTPPLVQCKSDALLGRGRT